MSRRSRFARETCDVLGNVSKYLQVFTALHQVLDIVDDREVQAKNLKKVHLLLRQVSIGQNLDQITKVVAAVCKKKKESTFILIEQILEQPQLCSC